MSFSRVARSLEMPSAWIATTASLIGIMVSAVLKQVPLTRRRLLPRRPPWSTCRKRKFSA